MAKKFRNIGATLSLNEGNFFVNIKKATSELGGLKKSSSSMRGVSKKAGRVASAAGKVFLTASAAGITAMTGLTIKSLNMQVNWSKTSAAVRQYLQTSPRHYRIQPAVLLKQWAFPCPIICHGQ